MGDEFIGNNRPKSKLAEECLSFSLFNEIMNHDALDQSQFNILEIHETSWKDPYQHDTPMLANRSILSISNHMMKSPTPKSLTIQILVQQVLMITTAISKRSFFKREPNSRKTANGFWITSGPFPERWCNFEEFQCIWWTATHKFLISNCIYIAVWSTYMMIWLCYVITVLYVWSQYEYNYHATIYIYMFDSVS